jgi:hypothetical protein
MEKSENKVLVGKLEGKRPLEEPDIGGSIILKWILNIMGGRGLDLSNSGQGSAVDSCERGNKPSGSIKFWESLEYPRNY